MSKSRVLPQDIAAEELMKIATSSRELVDMGKLTEVAKFIYELGIRHGDTKVPASLIYYTYKMWKGFQGKRQPKMLFFRDFKKHFKDNRDQYERYYLLDPSPFDLSKETYWEVRADVRQEKARKKKKK